MNALCIERAFILNNCRFVFHLKSFALFLNLSVFSFINNLFIAESVSTVF